MTKLQVYMEEYIAIRKSMGFNLRTHAPLLKSFVKFITPKSSVITQKLVLAWATLPSDASPNWWSYRLSVIHHFARYVASFDPMNEIPAVDSLPRSQRRPEPYIYSENELNEIIRAAKKLTSHNGLRGWTYSTLFALLSVSGLRISEALSLDVETVDLDEGKLIIRNTKYCKSRFVPLHSSSIAALNEYSRQRDSVFPHPKCSSFFVTVFGNRPTGSIVRMTFRDICCQIGIRKRGAKKSPRLHDIRHTFAVRSLINFYQQSSNTRIECNIYYLSVFMGHVNPISTYWYFSAVPELMKLIRQRLEKGISK